MGNSDDSCEDRSNSKRIRGSNNDNSYNERDPSPTSRVTVDASQNPRGPEGQKASMASSSWFGVCVTAPGLVRNERVGLGL